ncbi:uncharacterized protein LOC116412631 [Galleria mellonella]|uniref:Uncharacterized protein LOC116412631 n=1 Tax=Galleria mellonella TaxID=7137 RepID=A0ABM3MAR8_GALME|nr:uncharacterized protein LOC116412631 [Galleria mellonella]
MYNFFSQSECHFIPTRKGNHLVMFNKFTYSKDNRSRSNYYCSKRSIGCKARIKLLGNGKVIVDLPYEFIPTPKGNHLIMLNSYTYSKDNKSRNYYCSKKSIGCKARIKLLDNGKLIVGDSYHCHEPPKYVVTSSGKYVKVKMKFFFSVLPYHFIPTLKGNNLIMLNKFTYSKDSKSRNYYCSKKLMGCRARIKLLEDGKIVVYDDKHSHDPPNYVVTSSGKYVKFISFCRLAKVTCYCIWVIHIQKTTKAQIITVPNDGVDARPA